MGVSDYLRCLEVNNGDFENKARLKRKWARIILCPKFLKRKLGGKRKPHINLDLTLFNKRSRFYIFELNYLIKIFLIEKIYLLYYDSVSCNGVQANVLILKGYIKFLSFPLETRNHAIYSNKS